MGWCLLDAHVEKLRLGRMSKEIKTEKTERKEDVGVAYVYTYREKSGKDNNEWARN